ncbi:sulfite exporter TauE/SafE family protein [Desulfurobacterium atlanticum]|uniref:Probable membrane transporter protein n=1 Tax=Desulfurobacterium atlanticum TaxID=240169 RepID=A0A238XSY4_9BACT|nr:sulfite exporter TauE/SafE family protein [Desulfurobacterium atlanticum]SNR61621.1 Uncharacterized membrane protein YfcA [Desulfurobacterium atlanticum]
MLSHLLEAGIVLFVSGFFIGFLSGLLGKGGGLLLIPTFWFIFPFIGIPEKIVPKAAVATSLACMTVTSSTSAWQHIKKGYLKKDIFFNLLIGAVPGVFIGSAITARLLSPEMTKLLFAIFLIFMSLKMLKKPEKGEKTEKINKRKVLLTGFASGFIAGLLGIGGGSLVTPMLYSFADVPIKVAMATSTGIVFFNSFFSVLNYIYYGLNKVNFPYFFGYVYIPVLIFMVPSLYIGTRIGVRLMHRVNSEKLRKWFAVFLIFVAFEVILKLVGGFLK